MRYFFLEVLSRVPLVRRLNAVRQHVRKARLMRDFILHQGRGAATLRDVLPFYQADYLTQLMQLGHSPERELAERLSDMLVDEQAAKNLSPFRRRRT